MKIRLFKKDISMEERIQFAKKQIRGEMSEDALALRDAICEVLEEFEDAEVEISEDELHARIKEIAGEYGITIDPPQLPKNKTRICPTCGAPVHGKQCEYCSNIIN